MMRELQHVDPVAELAELGRAEGVVVAVQVEARHLGEDDLLPVEVRVGLAGEDLDRVPEIDQLTAEMAEVDALAAAVRLAPVGEQRDPQRPVFCDPAHASLP